MIRKQLFRPPPIWVKRYRKYQAKKNMGMQYVVEQEVERISKRRIEAKRTKMYQIEPKSAKKIQRT